MTPRDQIPPKHQAPVVPPRPNAHAVPRMAAKAGVILPPRRPTREDIILFIAKAGMVSLDTLVNRFFREKHQTLLEAKPRAVAALRRLALQEYLQGRRVVIDAVRATERGTPQALGQFFAKHYLVLAYCITPRAARDFNAPLPPTIRENFVNHHMRTMDAVVEVEKRYAFSGEAKVIDFKMESQLVREQFSGRLFRPGSGTIVPQFPDAQIVVRRSSGAEETLNIEYVSPKYTDEMILKKHTAFQNPTIWAVPNAATAARVERITGQPALLL